MASPMGVETPESQEVPLSQASTLVHAGTSPPVEYVDVTPSHTDRLQQAVGDRTEGR